LLVRGYLSTSTKSFGAWRGPLTKKILANCLKSNSLRFSILSRKGRGDYPSTTPTTTCTAAGSSTVNSYLLDFTFTERTKEFYGQTAPDRFGSIGLVVGF